MQPIFEVSVLMAPNATAVREVVFASLDEILKTGFPAEDVQAAIGQIEIGVPRLLATNERVGVSLFTEAVNTAFTYDRDVFQAFLNRSLLEELQSRVDSGEDVFGDLIRRYLLENPNRFDLLLEPSGTSIGESEAAALAATVSSLTPENALALAEETAAFREWQGIPDSPEALATVPALELSAIEDVLDIPTEVSAVDGGVLLEHPQPAGGLVFAQLDLRLNNVSDDQVALLPLLGVVLRNTGSGNLTAAALDQRINSRMAVIEVPEGKVLSQLPSGEPALSLRFKGSATSDMAGDLVVLMNDMLLRPGISRDDEEVEALVRVALQNRARSTEIELSQYEARTSVSDPPPIASYLIFLPCRLLMPCYFPLPPIPALIFIIYPKASRHTPNSSLPYLPGYYELKSSRIPVEYMMPSSPQLNCPPPPPLVTGSHPG